MFCSAGLWYGVSAIEDALRQTNRDTERLLKDSMGESWVLTKVDKWCSRLRDGVSYFVPQPHI